MSASQKKAMLIDVSKCMGCRACQVACKQWNQLPAEKTRFSGGYQNPAGLSSRTWTVVNFFEVGDPTGSGVKWHFRKQQCLHCVDATCVHVCPTGAAKLCDDGIVTIDQDVCTGCKYCVESCVFGTPKFDRESGTAVKCTMCADRVSNGLKPACATACPPGAISFGNRDEILSHAEQRVEFLRQKHPNARLYGKTELSGLGALYILPDKASLFGLPEDPRLPTARIMTKWLLGVVPGLAILYGVWRYFRKDELAADAKAGGK